MKYFKLIFIIAFILHYVGFSQDSIQPKKIKFVYNRPDGSKYVKYEGDRYFTEVKAGTNPNLLLLGYQVPKQMVYFSEGTIIIENYSAAPLFKNFKDVSSDLSLDKALDPELISFKVFPNPGSQRMCISFSLQSEKNVRIEIYNYIGGKPKVITDKVYMAGDNTLEINNDLYESSGMYIITFAVGNKKITNAVYLKK